MYIVPSNPFLICHQPLNIKYSNKLISGIERDKEMADKLIYIFNNDTKNYPFRRLKLVIETFGHSTYWTNQSKFN